jgi:heptosyltransferase-2
MSTPALRALRRAQPQAEIVLSGRPWVGELLAGIGSFDRFVDEPRRHFRATLAHAVALRREGFDWAVLFPDSVRVALAPFLARIPLRIGYARNALRRALLTRVLAPPRTPEGARRPVSMIERYLDVVRPLGCTDAGHELDLLVSPSAAEQVAARLERARLGGAGLLVVCPGAHYGASKLWPPEHFARACDLLSERGLHTVLAPGPGETEIAGAITKAMKSAALNLVDPVIGLPELAALIARARLLLVNDTGPRQMAVALGTPVVTVMGPTDPRHSHHLLERQRVLREDVDCSPCHLKTCPIDHRCMTRLRPERVVAAAGELLD